MKEIIKERKRCSERMVRNNLAMEREEEDIERPRLRLCTWVPEVIQHKSWCITPAWKVQLPIDIRSCAWLYWGIQQYLRKHEYSIQAY